MKEPMAKELVVRAGKELVKSGLIARTWGNVSCRIDEKTFVISPSGRAYETLKPEEIVLCQVEDASYESDIKPSSEKGIHALVYRTRPDINFVIHTHQPQASAISAIGVNAMPVTNFPLLSNSVPIASYGLPGTKKLRENIGRSLNFFKGHALIMQHHGALCFGSSYDETFLAAKQLEDACQDFVQKKFLEVSGNKTYDEDSFYRFYVSSVLGSNTISPAKPLRLFNSQRKENGFVLQGDTINEYLFTNQNMSPEALIHSSIYQNRKDINFIIQNNDNCILAASLANATLRPLLDDFAQIVGLSARCADSTTPTKIVKALSGRLGVLVPGAGALCCAATESDAHAVAQVMQKDALAQISAQLFGGGHYLTLFDCKLMHFVYTKSYAKKAKRSASQASL